MTEVADIPLQTIILKLKKIAPALMPPTAEDRLRDILEAIVKIEALLAGYNLDLFTADKTRQRSTGREWSISATTCATRTMQQT